MIGTLLRRRTMLLAGAVTLSLAAAPAALGQSVQKVPIGNSGTNLLWGVAYIAKEKGYFAQEGVEFEEITQSGSNNTINAVINRDIPFGMGALNDLIIANSKGQPLRAIAVLIRGYPNILAVQKHILEGASVKPDSKIEERYAFLKGKSIAVTVPGSSIDIFVQGMLRSVGLNPERDVTIVYGGNGPATVAAAKSKRVDAGVYAPPQFDELVTSGLMVKWIDPMIGEYPAVNGMEFSVLYARADTLTANRATAQKLVNALAKAETLLKNNKAEARETLRPMFARMGKEIYDSAFETMYPALSQSPAVTPAGYAATLAFVNSRTGEKPLDVPFATVVDESFVKAVPTN